MQFVDPSEIIVEDRQRTEMKESSLMSLERSIAHKGLLHAPVVRIAPEGMRLIAGERRIEAMKRLIQRSRLFQFNGTLVPPGKVPVVSLADLDELGYAEAELDENIMREELSWQDRTAAIEKLHSLRSESRPEQTKKDTAQEIAETQKIPEGRAVGLVDRATMIAPFLDDPEVAAAKSDRQALKIVINKIRGEFLEAQNREAAKEASPHTFILGDLTVEMPRFDRDFFHCCIADPPYGIDAHAFAGTNAQPHEYDDSPETAIALNKVIIREAHRVCRPHSFLYLFCDIDHFLPLREFATACGWQVRRTPLVWSKGSLGHIPEGSGGFRRSYELLLFAFKGTAEIPQVVNDAFYLPAQTHKVHAAQKPIELYRTLLSYTCQPGHKVLDPCCGAGTIFQASKLLNLTAYGIELEPKYGVIAQALANRETPDYEGLMEPSEEDDPDDFEI